MKKLILSLFVIILLFIIATACSNEKLFTIENEWLGNFDGREIIPIEELHILAAKGENLSFEDLNIYKWINFSSTIGEYLMSFSVESGYRMTVRADQNKIISYIALERIWDESGTGIDIRFNDVEKFMQEYPSHSALTVDEMKVIAEEYMKQDIMTIDLEWWEYADEFPHYSSNPEKQALRESLDNIDDRLELFMTTEKQFVAVSCKTGYLYIPQYNEENRIEHWGKIIS